MFWYSLCLTLYSLCLTLVLLFVHCPLVWFKTAKRIPKKVRALTRDYEAAEQVLVNRHVSLEDKVSILFEAVVALKAENHRLSKLQVGYQAQDGQEVVVPSLDERDVRAIERLFLAAPASETGCQTDRLSDIITPVLCDAASQTTGDIDVQDLLKSTQIQLRDAEEALLGTKLVADSRWDKMCDLIVLERALRTEISALRDENSALLNEKSALQDDNSALQDENSTCEELVHEQDRSRGDYIPAETKGPTSVSIVSPTLTSRFFGVYTLFQLITLPGQVITTINEAFLLGPEPLGSAHALYKTQETT